MKYIKNYRIFETDATFFYNPEIENKLPKSINVIKGDPNQPLKLLYKKGISRHLGPLIQIPYETTDTKGGRENPDTLEFDISYDYDTNNQSLSINVEVNYGDLGACQFQIESPNKIKVIRYTSLHSKDDPSNTVFAFDNDSIQSLCDYFNSWDSSFNLTSKDLKFLDY